MSKTAKRYTTAALGFALGATLWAPGAQALIDGDKAEDNSTTQAVARMVVTNQSDIDKAKESGKPTTVSATLCTGTLIDPEWVIAARHCVLDREDPSTSITLGTTADTEEEFEVTEVVKHDTDDIALYKLDHKADVTPVKIWDKDKAENNTKVDAFGWGPGEGGKQLENLTYDSGVLDTQPVTGTPHPNMLVLPVTYDKARATEGDSGGPMIIDDQLYGVLSMKEVVAEDKTGESDGERGFYMPITNYSKWINDSIGVEVAGGGEEVSGDDVPQDDSIGSIDEDQDVVLDDGLQGDDQPEYSEYDDDQSADLEAPGDEYDDEDDESPEVVDAVEPGNEPNRDSQAEEPRSTAGGQSISGMTPGPKVNTGGEVSQSLWSKIKGVLA